MPGLAFVYQRLPVQKNLLLTGRAASLKYAYFAAVAYYPRPAGRFAPGNLRRAHPLSWRSALRRRQD